MPTVDVEMAHEVDAAGSFEARTRRRLASNLLSGAEFFAHHAGRTEGDTAATLESSYSTIRHFVIGAVLLSAAAVEAHLNEVMEAEGTPKSFLSSIRKGDTIERYKKYLKFRGKPTFTKRDQPVAQLDILVALRNALLHFRPSWDDVEGDHSKLGRRLERAFKMSPLVPAGTAPIFPTRCMSHGCAAWAVATAKAFTHEFTQRLGR